MTFCSIFSGIGVFVTAYLIIIFVISLKYSHVDAKERHKVAVFLAFVLGCFVASYGEQISCSSDDYGRIEYDGRTTRSHSN